MDEPTAVLAPQEVDDLFRTLRSMTAAGRSIVFISHKLGEVLAIADRITVMRRGRVTAAALPAAGATRAQLATLMVGRPIIESLERTAAHLGDTRPGARGRRGDRRQGLARPARRLARGQVRRDRGHRGGGGQRPERAGRGRHGPALVPRPDPRGRRGHRQPVGPHGDRPRRGPRARGPQRRRQRAEPLARRQPDHEALPQEADRARLGDRRGRRAQGGGRPEGRLRHLGAVGRHAGAPALGRQPPAPDPRPRDRVGAAADDRRPADARPRRRGRRERPPAAPPAARGGRGDPAHVGGAGRADRPVGPHPR